MRVYGEGPLAGAIRQNTLPWESAAWIASGADDATTAMFDLALARREKRDPILWSTPIPVDEVPEGVFYVVETVRLAHAAEDFRRQSYIIVGGEYDEQVDDYLSKLTPEVIWMTVESAAMTKHALNGFLAVSVAYGNEIGRLCRKYGADPDEVAYGLRADPRIGRRAYISAGGPYGKHLEREINNLLMLGANGVIAAAKRSNL